MTSTRSHLDSEALASAAHEALRAGDIGRARALFADAAQMETDAFNAVSESKPRTLGIFAVSAAALWFKAGDFDAAALLAHRALANASLPLFAKRELRELLQSIWKVPTRGSKGSDKAAEQRLAQVMDHCMEAKLLADTLDGEPISYLLAMAIQETREAMRQNMSASAKRARRPVEKRRVRNTG